MIDISNLRQSLSLSILCLLLILSASGCASIFGGAGQNYVSITSNPSMRFELKNSYGEILSKGKTPSQQALDPKENYAVVFTAPNGEKIYRPVNKGLNEFFVLNILFWPGFLIDFITGAMYKIPNAIHVEGDS